MLALDRTIGCIEASESEVLDLYRSVPVTMTSAAGAEPASMEAYVCAVRQKPGVKVYLALVADDRRIYVYTEPGKFDGEDEFRESVQEALDFARALGFSPEPVALSYSPAMRAVVVRNIKILRTPGSKVRSTLKHGTADAPTPALLQAPTPAPRKAGAGSTTAPAAVTPPFAAITPPAPPASKPRTNPAAAIPPDEERELSAVQAISELKKGLKHVAAQKEAQWDQLQQLSELHQIALAELAGMRQECARLTAQRDELARGREQMEALTAEGETLRGERDSAIEQLRELTELHRVTAAELAGALEGCARLESEKEKLTARGKKQLESLAAERDDAKEKLQELAARHDTATDELAGAREECARLSAEKEALAGDSKQLQKLAADRDQAQHQVRELTELQQATAAQLAGAKEECARLSAQKEALAGDGNKQLRKVAAERDAAKSQVRELTALQQGTATELAGAKEECARLIAQRDELARSANEVERVTTERDRLAAELRELSALSRQAAAELQGAREECARLSKENDALQRAAQSAGQTSSELSSLHAEIAALSRQLYQTILGTAEPVAEPYPARSGVTLDALQKGAVPSADELPPGSSRDRDLVQPAAATIVEKPSAAAVIAEKPSAAPAAAQGAERERSAGAASPPDDALPPRDQQLSLEACAEPAASGEYAEELAGELELEDFNCAPPAEYAPPAAQEQVHLPAEETETALPVAQPDDSASAAPSKEPAPAKENRISDDLPLPIILPPLQGEEHPHPPPVLPLEGVGTYSGGLSLFGKGKEDFAPAAQAEDFAPAAQNRDSQADERLAPVARSQGGAATAHHPEFGSQAQFHDFSSDVPFHDFDTAAPSENFSSTAQSAEFTASAPTIAATDFPPLGELNNDFFCAASNDDDAPARFLLSSDMTAIECLSLDEVVELHQSINNANLSPAGKGQESCRGYICGLKKGASMRVYAAIFGTQSGRTSVYIPEVQPDDDQSYSRTVRGAISFAEEVGLMMEQVKLGASPNKQRDSLTRCPVLRSAEKGSSEGVTKH